MADNYNLVDNMLQDIQRNNSPEVLNYQPSMGGQQPPMYGGGAEMGMPPQQVQMGEVQYIPPEQQQAPMVQNNMMETMAGERMIPDDMVVEDAAMDAPDLSTYGMDEDTTDGMFDKLMGELKGPLIVIALAFVMSLPQVNAILRNILARVTTNPMYMNIAMAIILGLVFWLVMKLL